jgi:hypothetical protein
MKRLILVGAFALLAACGSSDNGVSVGGGNTLPSAHSVSTGDSSGTIGTSGDATGGSDDTITVTDFSDMPPKCIELLSTFLKAIEPVVSAVDWDKATLSDFESLGTQFQTESDTFDKNATAAGCDKYNLDASDEAQFQQMAALAKSVAPGTLGFINFLNSLSSSADATGGSIPADCDGVIAEIDPFIAAGGTMKDLTMVQVTRLGQLISAVSANCSADEATAFFGRADVTKFISG